jgi:hypothetical protein
VNQMIRKTTDKSRGIRLGNFVQIRTIIDEELEQVWAGKKSAKEGAGRPSSAATSSWSASRRPTRSKQGLPGDCPDALPAQKPCRPLAEISPPTGEAMP